MSLQRFATHRLGERILLVPQAVEIVFRPAARQCRGGDVGVAVLPLPRRRDLFPGLRAAGCERLRIMATRLAGDNPGRTVDLTIDLTREAK